MAIIVHSPEKGEMYPHSDLTSPPFFKANILPRNLHRVLILCLLYGFLLPVQSYASAFAQEIDLRADSSFESNGDAGVVQPDPVTGSPESLQDSLRLRALMIEREQAELDAVQTDFLHRLIPQVHISANVGVNNELFVDPSNSSIAAYPKDSYRLILSLSISDLLDFDRHRVAELRCDRLRAEYELAQIRFGESQQLAQREYAELQESRALLDEEWSMKEGIARFNDLRFQQGKIGYDTYIHSKLELLSVKKVRLQIDRRLNNLRLKLSHHSIP